MQRSILKGEIKVESMRSDFNEQKLRGLVRQMLTVDPAKRPTAGQLLQLFMDDIANQTPSMDEKSEDEDEHDLDVEAMEKESYAEGNPRSSQ